jgi:oligopeptide/dipeptide ABC transporter ATP-binding protein
MYLGKIVEIGKTNLVFNEPKHPYTKALISAIPVPNPRHVPDRLILEGDVPSPINLPPGCRFQPRCPFAMPVCTTEEPKLISDEEGRSVACYLMEKEV